MIEPDRTPLSDDIRLAPESGDPALQSPGAQLRGRGMGPKPSSEDVGVAPESGDRESPRDGEENDAAGAASRHREPTQRRKAKPLLNRRRPPRST